VDSVVALLDAIPGLEFVLQLAGLGGLIGMAIAYRLRRRNPEIDVWPTITLWTLLLAALAVVIQVGSEVLF
jgi:glycopeptide antibiotics resistance protein